MGDVKRKIRADGLKLRRLLVQAGLTQEKFCGKTGLDKATSRKLFKGEEVFLSSIVVAAKLFDIQDHLELLHPEELRELGVDPAVAVSERHVLEWSVDSYLTPWQTTANGLQYQIAKLTHRFLPHRIARGKCYELRHLPVAERERLAAHLRRHPEVCERVGKHPNVAQNLTAAFIGDGGHWWVLDDWQDGETLEDRLRRGPLEVAELQPVLLGIAVGLKALHQEGIIRRELSPRFVILRARDKSPLLTDFELAKLLDGPPTVSRHGEWPDDPYRALEVVGEGELDPRADLYSWGRIFVRAATGTLPPRGAEAVSLDTSVLPKSVQEVVRACVALPKTDRPGSIDAVLGVLKRWQA